MAKIKKELDQKIRQKAKNRCGYCLNPQELMPFKLEVEHIYPKALGGETVEENLWLACRECNGHKSKKVKATDSLSGKTFKLFNPRTQIWKEHFEFSQDKTEIIGKTPCGRATVDALQMNNIYQTTARLAWVETGKFPPKDI
ncbi:MAG: HNH endonuclease [Pyrinomonadaceae bacterium]|nr:HNH endonuclease [Pyrinomonadaceae bacterium]